MSQTRPGVAAAAARIAAAAAAVCLSAACLTAGGPPEPSEKVRSFLGAEAVDYLRRAVSAEAFRVGPLAGEKAGTDATVGGREVVGKAVPVGRETLSRLVAALLSDDTYFRQDSKGTKAGVGYRIRTDRGETVEVSCCLYKGNVWMVVKDAEGKVLAKGDRKGFRNHPESPMRAIAVELFPDDEELLKYGPPPVPPFAADAKPVRLADGFKFTEGPAADAEGNVYFTDQPNDRILKWSVDGLLSTFLEKAGRSNGLYFDAEGRLWACADENNELWRIDVAAKTHAVVVKDVGGRKLNGPNDVWVRPEGGAYFTDPFYKRPYWTRGPEEQDKRGVYHVSPLGAVTRVDDACQQPNGVVGSPDGKTLYVADVGTKIVFAYDIRPDGTLARRRPFCKVRTDGMTVDSAGNLYLAADKVYVFDKAGRKIGELAVPEQPSNLCFGGKDRKTLFITARTGLYAVPNLVGGAPAPAKR